MDRDALAVMPEAGPLPGSQAATAVSLLAGDVPRASPKGAAGNGDAASAFGRDRGPDVSCRHCSDVIPVGPSLRQWAEQTISVVLVVVLAEGGAEGAQSHGCGNNEVLVTVRNAQIEPRQCGLDEPTK
jgi:hypothetical protein